MFHSLLKFVFQNSVVPVLAARASCREGGLSVPRPRPRQTDRKDDDDEEEERGNDYSVHIVLVV